MPTTDLSKSTSRVAPYDVVGIKDANGFLSHAMLCNEADQLQDVTGQTVINAVHMGPPFGKKQTSCDIVGTANLSDVEKRKAKTFVDERLLEREAQLARLRLLGKRKTIRAEYTIYPDAVRPTAQFPLWRFSCVGFVRQAYRRCGIHLLSSELPEKSLSEIKTLYPNHSATLNNKEDREQLGLRNGMAWGISLAGYLFHSLARDNATIRSRPFIPKIGDEQYP